MKRIPTAIPLCVLLLSAAVQLSFGQARTITFDGSKASSVTRIDLKDLGSGLPSDWSGYEALVLELRASSPQRFSLKIYTGAGEQTFSRVLMQPYPGAWIRAAIPVSMLSAPPTSGHDMAAVGNRSRPGYFIGLWGPFVPLKAVTSIGFEMEAPIGSPKVEIRSVSVAEKSPGDAVLEPLPLMDEFGQWIPAEWPGKAISLDALKKAWDEEARTLKSGGFGYGRYGGYAKTKAKATGFFRVEEIDAKWWFVDPDGHLFLSVGSDVIQPEMVTRTAGREAFFRAMPPASLRSDGPQRDEDPGASFFTWNLARRFGDDWRSRWVDFTIRRMDAWGLNTVANWSTPELWRAARKPYVIPLGRWETKASYLGLPDVYSPEFTANVNAAAKLQCEPRKNDPWLIGYFLANEPPFPQKELQTVDLILAGSDTATRRELQKWLAAEDTPERRKKFIEDAFDRYIQVTSQAVKKYDPNHLNLGMRSGGHPTEAEIRVSRPFDVYSVNVYDYQVSAERLEQITRLTGKPVIIGEFHFGVPGRGLAASLVQVKDQKQRGAAYRYYVEQAFAMPGLIGTHWFQWADQPATGRFDGENYNIGLVDVTDRPYDELVEALQVTHKRLYDVHSQRQQPFSTKAVVH
ncbi:MAG TPA: hypothetical protein VN428_06430 [Bryobacteraceae bacterium]|nr:hypothetical protein [Bryobacteraceae bacterium]